MGKKLQQFLAGFLEGFTKPGPASLLVVLLTVLFLIFCFTPQVFTRIPHEYFIARPKVLDVLASQKMLKLKDAPQERLAVTLIGASSLQEALLGEEEMERLLSARLQRPVTLTKIAVRGIELFDVIRFVDQIPADYKGIVIICVSVERYESPRKSVARFPLSSSLYNEELRKAGFVPSPQTGVFLIDNYRFFSTRSSIFLKNIVFEPVNTITHVLEGVGFSEREVKKKEILTDRAKSLPFLYQSHSKDNFQILSVIFRRLRDNGIYGIYLNPPRNLEFLQPLFASINRGNYLETLDRDIMEFAHAFGITYWNMNDKRYFGFDDFRDFSHISNDRARSRYTGMLFEKLEHLLRVEFQEKG